MGKRKNKLARRQVRENKNEWRNEFAAAGGGPKGRVRREIRPTGTSGSQGKKRLSSSVETKYMCMGCICTRYQNEKKNMRICTYTSSLPVLPRTVMIRYRNEASKRKQTGAIVWYEHREKRRATYASITLCNLLTANLHTKL